jgi:outer membrane protein W
MMKRILLFVILFCSLPAKAGYFEIGGSGSYRKTSQDKDNYSVFKSITGSVAYYFWELSALEVSYTRARQDENYTTYSSTVFQEIFETDFIFTLATRKSTFQPYIKVGAAYQVKKSEYKQPNTSPTPLPTVRGWGPSGGIGFKFMMNENLALKAGIDIWSSPLNQDPVTYDYAFRGGLSVLF